jgi:hypothetical protein
MLSGRQKNDAINLHVSKILQKQVKVVDAHSSDDASARNLAPPVP